MDRNNESNALFRARIYIWGGLAGLLTLAVYMAPKSAGLDGTGSFDITDVKPVEANSAALSSDHMVGSLEEDEYSLDGQGEADTENHSDFSSPEGSL